MKRRDRKVVLISVVSALIAVLAIFCGYNVMGNRDATCYNYSTHYGSCSSDFTKCGEWGSGVRYCDGTQAVTYTVTSTYRCGWFGGARGVPASTYRTCQVAQYDNTSPDTTRPEGDGGIN